MNRQCAILLGGLGTRLGAIAQATPKPLLNVGGAPFVEVLIGEARRRGFRDFLLLAGHRSEVVTAFLSERAVEQRFDCRVVVSVEPTPLGTGGALVHAGDRLQDDFLLLNGDTWFDFNWLDLFAAGRRAGAAAWMALRSIEPADRYETVELAGDQVRAIHPRGNTPGAATINGGVYYLTRAALAGLGRPASLESELLPGLARSGALRGSAYAGFFIDIGVPETLKTADVQAPGWRNRPAVFLGHNEVFGPDGRLAAGAPARVKALNDAGRYVFVLPGDGSNIEAAARDLAAFGASVDNWGPSPIVPLSGPHDASAVRTIEGLLQAWPVDLDGSVLQADDPAAIEAAEACGLSVDVGAVTG